MEAAGQDDVNGSDLREQIVRLEAQIEELAEAIESCRKIILISRAAVVLGGFLIVAMIFGAVWFNSLALIAAITAVIGGIVLFGSNKSTSDQATAALRAAEARRAELISGIDLRLVGDRATFLPAAKTSDPSS
jgi:hypothetical protein